MSQKDHPEIVIGSEIPTIDISKFWDQTSAFFDLPSFGEELQEMVMPIMAINDGSLHPIGTCFTVSPFGLVMSASHNVTHGLIEYSRSANTSKVTKGEGSYTQRVKDLSLCTFWHRKTAGRQEGMFWPIANASQNMPGDIVFARLWPATWDNDEPVTFKHLSLSPGMPRAGSSVFAVGYHDMPQQGQFEIDSTMSRVNVDYWQRLSVSVGSVETLYSERRDHGMFAFPCFRTNASLPAGFSGGPVFDEHGYVCGVTSGESVYDQGGFVSLIYPSLVTQIDLGVAGNPKLTTILDLIADGAVLTDGTEKKASYQRGIAENTAWSVVYEHESINEGFCFVDVHEEHRLKGQ